MTLNGDKATGMAPADMQAGLYRELLNYGMSPELRQHVLTSVAQLQEVNPKITSEPLGHVDLGSNNQTTPKEPEQTCKECYLVHPPGECPW